MALALLKDTATLPRALATPTDHVRVLTGSSTAAEFLSLLVAAFDHTIHVGLRAPDVQPNAEQVAFFLLHRLSHEPVEVLYGLFFNGNGSLIHDRELARGSLSACLSTPSEIARTALALGASAVVLAHNHPSGSSNPSACDIHFSAEVAASLALADAALIDHLIVAGGITVSMRRLGCLPKTTAL